jgi:hypothetical protein
MRFVRKGTGSQKGKIVDKGKSVGNNSIEVMARNGLFRKQNRRSNIQKQAGRTSLDPPFGK